VKRTELKQIVYGSLILACVSADVGLIFFLMKEIVFSDLDNLFLFLISVMLFAATLVATQRKILFQRKSAPDLLKITSLIQEQVLGESMVPVEKKKFKPSPAPKPKLEFAMHNCPEHGPERFAGNYMNLHSCNAASNSATQTYWEEKTPEPTRKQNRVSSTAVL
jgi:hypothetical protein